MSEITNRASETQTLTNIRRMNSNRRRFLALGPKVLQSKERNATYLQKKDSLVSKSPATVTSTVTIIKMLSY